jgi:hypothetical protein
MGSIKQNHLAPMNICEGGDHSPPKRKNSGPSRPRIACATSNVGARFATMVPMEMYTVARVKQHSRWKAHAAKVGINPNIK